MAKTKNPTTPPYPKPNKTSIFLCCFGSPLPMKVSDDNPDPKVQNKNKKKKKKKRTSWFSWRRIIPFNKNSTAKTVPLEPSSLSDHHKPFYSKSKSKSTLHPKSQTPRNNPPPPPVLPGTPYYTPSQTRHGANSVEDTRQQGRASPAHAKRQARRVSSSSMQTQTTAKKVKNARGSYDSVVGMSVLVVTLVIMVFWGRLCAILCTSAWLYFIPRFRKSATANDDDDEDPNTKWKEVDLDSEVYKKKVIMEGLLERNHRGSH